MGDEPTRTLLNQRPFLARGASSSDEEADELNLS